MVRHRRIARGAELAEGDRTPLPVRRRRRQGRGPGRKDAVILGGARRSRVHADAGYDVLFGHRGGEGSRLRQRTLQGRGGVVGSPGHIHARADVSQRRGHRSRRAQGHGADQAVIRDRMPRGGRVPGRQDAIIRSTACPSERSGWGLRSRGTRGRRSRIPGRRRREGRDPPRSR